MSARPRTVDPADCPMRSSHHLLWLCTTCSYVAPEAVADRKRRATRGAAAARLATELEQGDNQ